MLGHGQHIIKGVQVSLSIFSLTKWMKMMALASFSNKLLYREGNNYGSVMLLSSIDDWVLCRCYISSISYNEPWSGAC
jgi:hypothetical protein